MSPIEQYTIDCEFSPVWGQFFLVFRSKKKFKKNSQIYIMQLFSAEPTTFSKKNFRFILHPKTWKTGHQKLLIIGPNFFFSVLPIRPKPAQITFSVFSVSLRDFYIMTLPKTYLQGRKITSKVAKIYFTEKSPLGISKQCLNVIYG